AVLGAVRPGGRGGAGLSAGGVGARVVCRRLREIFGGAASLSGDCHFEVSYAANFHAAARGLLAHGSDPARFLEAFALDPDLSGDGHAVIDLCAMSACYSPNLDSPVGFDLPIDPETGERVPEVWERWLAFDPLHACVPRADAWRGLELLHLECGRRDEFHLQFALRVLSRKLRDLDVDHHHEEHDGGHFGIDDRYLAALPRVIEALVRP
ncbi:MAG: esterase, partial [Planctomycetota bacterium]|nr:esterase [Planctomycetota bacterium]